MDSFTFIVPCLFGLEGIIAEELRELGFEPAAENGRVRFCATAKGMAKANMWLRCGERVLLLVGEFKATTFEELFENTKALPWEQFISKDGQFPVKGHSLNSKLFSVSDCQAIIKKAVVERLKSKYNINWFPETAEKYQIQFAIMKDIVTLTIDTSGEGLHKRGYRRNASEAPLRETLAAALVRLSRFAPGMPLCDPMCGSGTIAIEAAMIGRNIAPGIKRDFSAEHFKCFDRGIFEETRIEAKDSINDKSLLIYASDNDQRWVDLTKANAILAGVSSDIKVNCIDVAKLKLEENSGIIVTNPPYGQRLLDINQSQELYKVMGKVFSSYEGWTYYIISSDEKFETYFGRKADKKRKLYNGMIKCDLYMYFRRRRN